MSVVDDRIKAFCGCRSTVFTGFAVNHMELQNFKINNVVFQDITFRNVSFDTVVFNGTEFVDCQFLGCNFTKTWFNATYFKSDVVFDSVSLRSSSMCPLNGSEVQVKNFMTLYGVDIGGTFVENGTFNETFLDAALDMSSEECDMKGHEEINCNPPDYRVYRDSFFISASGLPGNIVSAFAVYFFPRNYWLGELN